MFTGLVEEVGTVEAARHGRGALRLRLRAPRVSEGLAVGASVAVSGACLTAVAVDDGAFEVELTEETVARTADRWREGAGVNLERALALGDRLGGHLVTGHVEGVGTIETIDARADATVLGLRVPPALAPWLVPKGNLTIDGVALTVVDVGGPVGSSAALDTEQCTLWLVPHTREVTTLGALAAGDRVNLETDLMARYAARAARVGGTAEARETEAGT